MSGYQKFLIDWLRKRADSLERAAKQFRETAEILDKEIDLDTEDQVWSVMTGRDGKLISQGEAVYEVLAQSKTPLTKTEIHKALPLLGCFMKNAANIAPLLTKDKRIYSPRRGYWTIKESGDRNEKTNVSDT